VSVNNDTHVSSYYFKLILMTACPVGQFYKILQNLQCVFYNEVDEECSFHEIIESAPLAVSLLVSRV
jgi:hypothetical protein